MVVKIYRDLKIRVCGKDSIPLIDRTSTKITDTFRGFFMFAIALMEAERGPTSVSGIGKLFYINIVITPCAELFRYIEKMTYK